MLRRIVLSLVFALSASSALAENILVIVDLQMQTMHVRIDGVTKYRWDVSSGRSGYSTPPGRYQPIRMHKTYFSRKYDDAPMPFAIFFHGGYAIHGTGDLRRLGRVASHGCVRLHPDNAQTLFELVKQVGPENTVIRVESHRTTTAILTEPQLLEPAVAIEAAEIEPESLLEDLTTGSADELTTIPWLRNGLNS